MDNRVLIWMAVAMIWLLVYQAWQRDFGPQRAPVVAEAPATNSLPTIEQATAPPTLDSALPAPQIESSTSVGPSLTEQPDTATQKITVVTDVYELEIDTTGGTLRNVRLLGYPKQKDRPDDLVVLLQPQVTALQTGLLASQGLEAPSHDSVFTTASNRYELGANDDTLEVTLNWQGTGVNVDKTYVFKRGRYNIGLQHRVTNTSDANWSGAQYTQLKGNAGGAKRSIVDVDSYSFVGTALYDGESFERYDLGDLLKKPLGYDAENGWIANLQHHFLSAAIPPPGETIKYSSRTPNDNTMLISGVAPLRTVAPGSSLDFAQQLFVGPKIQEQLEETAENLTLSVDYALTIIAAPMFWLLNTIFKFVGNWGLAIILLTVLIKIVFYPLAEKAGRSTAKMRTVAPRLKQIQERYKDDKQAQSKAMMELYKKEQINPAAGCLPLLIQMPVFLALYWVLIESVELRQAPFFGWIQDLSSRDPLYILPLIMAVAMYVQTKLNPAPPDPTMARVMTFMPIIMSVFFMFFPAGLVLYWVVNTVLSVIQQWRINKVVEANS
ncbi:MAG: membrane protein insertase YidC [Pseudomonadota bacterium]